MNRGKKAATIIASVILLAVLAAMISVRVISHRGLPDYTGKVQIPGMKDGVTVYRDAHAVPHIFAENEDDLYMAVGYCMAQDRLWQMDLLRRVTTGRLSEIFGEDMVEADELFRTLRIPEKSRMVMEKTGADIKRAARMFCAGVNHYIRENLDSLPVEFTILGYEPEEWKPIHSVNLVGYMAWDLTNPWDIEPALFKIREKVGNRLYRELIPESGKDTQVYPGFADSRIIDELPNTLFGSCRVLDELGLRVFQGSNNWAVSGKKSVTGMPLFANDMHLGFSAQGIWTQMHQSVKGGLDVTGVVLPGQPFIIAGHNLDIAWGFTNVSVDDMDFFLEKINPDNPREYLYRGNWRKMKVQREIIKVKGGKRVEREILITVNGPIVSKFRNVKDRAISMKWLGNEYSNELRTVYMLNRAGNWNEFRDAIKTFISVSQNICYADVKGNIGMYCAAGIPIRKKGNASEIYPGWTGEYGWKGMVPFERKPHSFNPPEGYVSSANNRTAPPGYPWYVSDWYSVPYRIDRIREMLTEKDKLGIDDFRRMHVDQRTGFFRLIGKDLIAAAKGAKELSKSEKKGLEILEKWDGIERADSPAPAIMAEFFQMFTRNTFADEMGEDIFRDFLKTKVFADNGLWKIWRGKKSEWFDDVNTADIAEGFEDIVLRSYSDCVLSLSEKFGKNPEKWEWGDIHRLTLKHPLGSVKALNLLFRFNRGPFKVGGSGNTVSPYSFHYYRPYDVSSGASHRHIYDLADWNRSLSVIPTGISGVPASEHYCDQTGIYLSGEYHPDYVSRKPIEREASYIMTMTGTGEE